MDKIYRKLFWGFVITTFHMTIGVITILSEVIGWMVVMNAFVDWGKMRQKKGVPHLKLLGVLLIFSSLIFTARIHFYPSASSNYYIILTAVAFLFLFHSILLYTNFSYVIASLVFLLARLHMLFILYSLSKQEKVSIGIE